MNRPTSTEQILQCNHSEPLADACGRIVDLMNENAIAYISNNDNPRRYIILSNVQLWWVSVVDSETTLKQHWLKLSCLLGNDDV